MHSIVIHTDLAKLASRFNAEVDIKAFRTLFRARLKNPEIKICRGLEFALSGDAVIEKSVVAYRALRLKEEKAELKQQEKRLKEAEAKLKKKPTKTAETEKKRAERKIRNLGYAIQKREGGDLTWRDHRVFPLYYAPLLVVEKGKRLIRPFRFHCRPRGTKPAFDKEYSTYKARKEKLQDRLWKRIFGRTHGLLVLERFYEFSSRGGGKGSSLGFAPRAVEYHLAPCIYDVWKSPNGKEALEGFAVITKEAPPEIARAGYHRCPIFLREGNVDDWLTPEGKDPAHLLSLLDDGEPVEFDQVA